MSEFVVPPVFLDNTYTPSISPAGINNFTSISSNTLEEKDECSTSTSIQRTSYPIKYHTSIE